MSNMYAFYGLEGRRVKLIPLELAHTQALYDCSRYPEVWENYPTTISTIEEMEQFVLNALASREQGDQFPYVVFDKELNKIVGTTRYLRISEANTNLNIGSTWYSPIVWRTRVNTESKYLLLSYAFENLHVNRVEIITTTTNERSQKAIERLGAIREGLLRKKYNNLDYVIYSIIDSEWRDVKGRLERFLEDDYYSER